jgi:hypothetical protein
MLWSFVKNTYVMRVDVKVLQEIFTFWIFGNVEKLISAVVLIRNAMGMVAILPSFSGNRLADSKREASLDQLDTTFDGLVLRRCHQDMNVVGHNSEPMNFEAFLFAIAKQGVHHKFGVRGTLKDAASLVGDRCDGEGFWIEADSLNGDRRHISGAKAPLPFGV